MATDPRVSTGGSVAARLAMCASLMQIRDAMKAAAPDKKDRITVLGNARIRALRDTLLGRTGGGALDDLMNPAVAAEALSKVLAQAEGLPPAERERAAMYVKEIAIMLFMIAKSERASGMPGGSDSALTTVHALAGRMLQDSTETADAAVDGLIARGRFEDSLREQAATAATTAGALTVHSIRLADVAPDIAEELEKINAEVNRLSEMGREINRKWRQTPPGDERERLEIAEVDIFKERRDLLNSDRFAELSAKADEALKQGLEAAQKPIREVGQRVIDDVLSGSSITQEQAEEWAAGVEITKTAAARLKKIGYQIETLRADMAEFYRLTSGRVSKVKIDSKGDRRANATNIDQHGTTGSVFLDSRFSKRTLWHELAHHIEADPVARNASGRLIRRRSVDGKAYTLKSLTGNPGYRAGEVAYKDGFFNAYVGKIYHHGITEVFSMGIESFSDPLMLGRRIAQDPETLEFVAGFMKAEIDPLERAFLSLRDALEEMSSEAKEGEGATVEAMISRLAERVEITKDDDRSWDGYGLYKGKQIGTVGGWHIIEDRVRDYYGAGGRKVAGFMLVRPFKEPDPYREGETRRGANLHGFPSRDKVLLRAAVAIFQKTGSFPSQSELNNVAFLQSHIDDKQP